MVRAESPWPLGKKKNKRRGKQKSNSKTKGQAFKTHPRYILWLPAYLAVRLGREIYCTFFVSCAELNCWQHWGTGPGAQVLLHPVFNLFVFFIFLKTTVSTLIPGDLPIHLKDVFIYRSSFPDAVAAQGDMPGPAHTLLPRAEQTTAWSYTQRQCLMRVAEGLQNT